MIKKKKEKEKKSLSISLVMNKAFLNYFYTKEVPQPQVKVLLEESEFKL